MSPELPKCKYGDPLCPCQDGDICHYEGENPMKPPELPKKWVRTHRMIHTNGRENAVMLTSSGAAYTRGDWAVRKSSRSTSTYLFLGKWYYLREPFEGTVVAL